MSSKQNRSADPAGKAIAASALFPTTPSPQSTATMTKSDKPKPLCGKSQCAPKKKERVPRKASKPVVDCPVVPFPIHLAPAPADGTVTLALVTKVDPALGVYVALLEYPGQEAFAGLKQCSQERKGRVVSVVAGITAGDTLAVRVLRSSHGHNGHGLYVDVTLVGISSKHETRARGDYTRSIHACTILQDVATAANVPVDSITSLLIEPLVSEFGTVYTGLAYDRLADPRAYYALEQLMDEHPAVRDALTDVLVTAIQTAKAEKLKKLHVLAEKQAGKAVVGSQPKSKRSRPSRERKPSPSPSPVPGASVNHSSDTGDNSAVDDMRALLTEVGTSDLHLEFAYQVMALSKTADGDADTDAPCDDDDPDTCPLFTPAPDDDLYDDIQSLIIEGVRKARLLQFDDVLAHVTSEMRVIWKCRDAHRCRPKSDCVAPIITALIQTVFGERGREDDGQAASLNGKAFGDILKRWKPLIALFNEDATATSQLGLLNYVADTCLAVPKSLPYFQDILYLCYDDDCADLIDDEAVLEWSASCDTEHSALVRQASSFIEWLKD